MEHNDTYRPDKIVELAADLGISPSFPIPEILSTFIATKEYLELFHFQKKLLKNLVLKEGRNLPLK